MDFSTVSTPTIENTENNDNFTFITIPIQNIDTISTDQLQSEYILKSLEDGSFILEGPQVTVTQIDEVNNYFNEQLFVDPRPTTENQILITSESTENEKFVCQFCNEKFSNKVLLRKHEKGHMQEKPYKCEKCSASYNVLMNLQLHQMLCTNQDKTLKCPVCNKIFSRFASLKAHLAIHQSDDQLFCPECEKPFDTSLQVDIHMKTHAKVRKYTWQCRLCKEEFSNQTSYRSHIAEHSKIRQLLSTLKSKSNIKRPSFKRNKVGRHVCIVCSKSFTKYSLLIRHSRVHSGEKPFKCKTCGSAFSQKNTLKSHMHKHTGTRPYKCSLCSAAFSQIGNLRVHIIRVHSLERNANTFPCNECECIFRKLSTLNAHINRVHNNLPAENTSNPFNVIKEIMLLNKAMTSTNNDKSTDILQQAVENSAIQDTTSTQNSWENSDKNKPNKTQDKIIEVKNETNVNLSETNLVQNDIEIRPIALADRGPDGTLRRHVVYQRKVGNIRWHQCSYCPKEFKKPSDLVRHIRIHTNEKPYKCHICERSFTVKTTLTSHLRTHANQKTKKSIKGQKENVICDEVVDNPENSTAVNNQCPFCNKKIPNKKLLESHIKKHELKTNLNSNKSLLSNIQLHEPFYVTDKGTIESYVSPKNRNNLELRPHKCVQCNAAFRKMSHLKQHLHTHSDEKPFSCNICNRNFRSSGVLKNHKKSHEGIRSYSCKECNNVFSTSGSLQRHLASHSTRRPFLCPYCHKSFKTFSNCRKHISTHKLEIAMNNLQNDESKSTNEVIIHEEIIYMNDKNIQVISNEGVNLTETESSDNVGSTEAINVINTIIADETGNVTLAELNTPNIPVDMLLNVQESLDKNLMPSTETLDDIITETNVVSENLQSVGVENNCNNPINVVFTVSEENDNMLLEVSKHENTINNFEDVPIKKEAVVTPPDLFVRNKMNNALEIVQDIPEETSNSNNIILPGILNIEDVNKVKKNQCTYCAKSFRKPSDLTRHIRTHTGERPFFCHICDKKFSLNSTLRSHLKIHGSITKDFVCTVCSKTFGTKGSLKVHMRLHTGVRPFPCDYCGLRFRTSGHKLAHHQAHLKEIERQKNDATSKSSKNFRTKNKMRKLHDGFVLENESNLNSDSVANKIANETDKSNENPELETIYLVQKQMEMDLSQFQETPLNIGLNPSNILDADVLKSLNSQECINFNEIIVQSVNSQSLVTNTECETVTQNFIQVHDNHNFANVEQDIQEKKMFLCGFCLKIFEKSSQLQRHLRIHTGERPFVCSFCNKSFNQKNALDRHLKTHLDHRPYECPHCEHKFTQKGNLKIHIQRTHESGKITVNDTLLIS